VCCAPARLEEIEGDLCEIYARRRARSGDKPARIRYVLDVLDVCFRQVLARIAVRPAGSTLMRAALTVYPGRIRACLVLTAALLVLLQVRWAGIAPTLLFVIDGVFELIVLASAAMSLIKQLVSQQRVTREQHASTRRKSTRRSSSPATLRGLSVSLNRADGPVSDRTR
jgi:hypothetical protein